MKTSADVRPWIAAALATSYVVVFWALYARAPSAPPATPEPPRVVVPAGWRVATAQDLASPAVTVTPRATPVTRFGAAAPMARGRIRTRSS